MDAVAGTAINDVPAASPAGTRAPAAAANHWGPTMDVTVENVERTFGETPALHGVSLKINAGELVAERCRRKLDIDDAGWWRGA